MIGISIGTQMQLMAGPTFCKMIKESFPRSASWSVATSSRGCRKNGAPRAVLYRGVRRGHFV